MDIVILDGIKFVLMPNNCCWYYANNGKKVFNVELINKLFKLI